jgi:hypothetical protein
MEKGYEKTYNWVKGLLKNCDFSDSSKRLGLKQISENKIFINFFDRTYQITKEDIEIIEEKTIWTVDSEGYEFDLKSVLGYYVLSEANTEPMHEYCTFSSFSGGVFRESYGLHNNEFMDIFGNDYKKFGEIMSIFGMEYEEGNRDGKYIWNYKILPKMPIKIIFYEGDDLFSSKMQILFDKTAIKIYKFESLAVLYQCIFQTIMSIGKSKNIKK